MGAEIDAHPDIARPLLRVAHCGRVSDIRFNGGSPYFMWQALAQTGLRVAPHDLIATWDVPAQRLAWRIRETLALRGARGYMFSNDFLEVAWSRAPRMAAGDAIVNIFQLFPESVLARAERQELTLFHYIDLSLRELFYEWLPATDSGHLPVSPAHCESAIARERRGYVAARKIVTFSRRTARALVSDYAIDPRKIATVMPGASLDEAEVDRALERRREPTGEFIVGYVGSDHQRKGLPTLAAAVLAARQAGLPISLRVIGPSPAELENTPGIELVGKVDKFAEMGRFIELISSCHIGCLLSKAEGLPISLLEFLRVGVPVLSTNVNGIPDIVKPGLGILVEPSASAAEVSGILSRLAAHKADYLELRQGARQAQRHMSWPRAAAELYSTLFE
ncbi:MAG TPA: glycosyltransferase family 4 protein [Stellaceae bacterium]|nr:glycosyltransferase family 4 protein [Stellaceae bacterium]